MPHTRKTKQKKIKLDDIDNFANRLNWEIVGTKENREYTRNNIKIKFMKGKGVYKGMVYRNQIAQNTFVLKNKEEAMLTLMEYVMLWNG